MYPILLCDLQGGIGNQLFQVATTYSLAKRLGTEAVLMDGQFCGGGQCSHPSKYYDTLYKKFRRISSPDSSVRRYEEKQWTAYNLEEDIRALSLTHSTLIIKGYFQSDRYFQSATDIRNLFTPEEGIRNYLKRTTDMTTLYPDLFADSTNVCFIGVRRGDYLKHAHIHNPCGMDYYKKAMHLVPATKYYIASDDMAWCKANFVGDQYVFFDINDDLIQLFVGCLFNKYILGNSSYHWWMSFLSVYETPTIVAPDKWDFGPDVKWEQYSSIYRKGMVVIERSIEV
jgi:hypothetical protein